MKKKIINTLIDIALITVVFSVTDILMMRVLYSENLWLELGVYIVLYGIVFGTKAAIVYLWKKRRSTREEEQDRKK